MKLEKFKEKNPKKVGIILFTIACVFLVAGVFFYTSFASFESKETYNLMEGNVQNPGDIYFAYYIDGVASQNAPLQNTEYTLDESASSCTNGVIPSWDHSTWQFEGNYSNYNSSDESSVKCNLYFIKNETVSTALGELSVYPYTPDYTKSACDDEICESHEKGIYETTDEEGTSYYYRGSVENNYLEFAGYYWRVIRINGDGTIRIIYDGTEPHANGDESVNIQIGASGFNMAYSQNEYVGYMYTLGEAHGLGTSSIIKEANDEFYESHLASYTQYIDTNAGFCGDRSTLNLQNGVGTGTVTTYYKGYLRMLESSPSLLCENTSDLYTHTSSNKGNKALIYPIGLITMDEVMLAGNAGGIFNGGGDYVPERPSSVNNYLTTNSYYWTMTPVGGYNPYGFPKWYAHLFFVYPLGYLDDSQAAAGHTIRPTINLKSDLEFTGDGTIDNAYKIKAE